MKRVRRWVAFVALALLLSASSAPPVSIEVVAGAGQQAAPGQTLGSRFGVRLTDQSGAPIAGAAVTFSVPAGSGGFVVEDPASGTIRTVAGKGNVGEGLPALAASFSSGDLNVAAGPLGVTYLADTGHRAIRKIDPWDNTFLFMGTGRPGPPVGRPGPIAVDAASNVYFFDEDAGRVRRIDGTTLAATTLAEISDVVGLAVAPSGHVFAVVSGPSGGSVMKLDPTSGPVVEAESLGLLGGIAVRPSGELVVTEPGAARILSILPGTGVVTIVGGTLAGFAGDGGPALAARFNGPTAVVADDAGNLLILDSLNRRVRRIDPTGTVTTVAGSGAEAYAGDGGPAPAASLGAPVSIAVDGDGLLWIADAASGRIRRVEPDGTIWTVGGSGMAVSGGDDVADATFAFAADVGVDAVGAVFVADVGGGRIRRILDGLVGPVVGGGDLPLSSTPTAGAAVRLDRVERLAVDGGGRVLFADGGGIYRWDPADAKVSLVHESGPLADLADSPDGSVYYVVLDEAAGQTRLVRFDGASAAAVLEEALSGAAVAVDRGGIAIFGRETGGLSAYAPASGTVTGISGQPAAAVAVDRYGHLYVAGPDHTIVYVDRATGQIIHVAGTGAPGQADEGVPAATVDLAPGVRLRVAPDGRLLIAGGLSDAILEISFAERVLEEFTVFTDLAGLAFAPPFRLGAGASGPFEVTVSVADASPLTIGAAAMMGPGGAPAMPSAAQGRRHATNNESLKHPRWTPMTSLFRDRRPTASSPDGKEYVMNSHRAIAVDSHNIVHIVHREANSDLPLAGQAIWYFTDRWEMRKSNGFSDGFDVSATGTLTGASEVSLGAPSVAVEGKPDTAGSHEDTVHVVWSRFTDADGSPGLEDYWSIHRRNIAPYSGSPSWSAIAAVATGSYVSSAPGTSVTTSYDMPILAADPKGGMHLVYRRTVDSVTPTSGSTTRTLLYSKDFGAPFEVASGPSITPLDVDAGPDGVAHIIFLEDGPAPLGSRVVYSQGGAAGTPIVPNWATMRLAVDGSNVPHFVRAETDAISGDIEVVYRLGPGGADIVVADDTTTAFAGGPEPLIDVEENGVPHILFARAGASTTIPDFDFGTERPAYATRPTSSASFQLQDPIDEVLANTSSLRTFGVPMAMALSRTGTVHYLSDPKQPITGAKLGGDLFYSRSYEPNLGSQDPFLVLPAGPGLIANAGNGNLTMNLPLFGSRGVGFATSFSLLYNSGEPGRGVVSPGWQHNYHLTITDHIGTTGPYLTLQLGDGRLVVFEQRIGSLYVPDPEFGYSAKIERSPSTLSSAPTSYTLTTKNGVKYRFMVDDDENGVADGTSDGKLGRIEDTQSTPNLMKFVYSGNTGSAIAEQLVTGVSGQAERVLTTITDSADRDTLLSYGSRNHLTEVEDPAGGTYSLSYDADGRLASVGFPLAGVTWSFTHSAANLPTFERFGFLRSVATPRGTAGMYSWTLLYYDDNRFAALIEPIDTHATEAEGAAGALPALAAFGATRVIAYADAEPGATGPGPQATFTDRRGHETVISHEIRRNLAKKVTDPMGHFIEREFGGSPGSSTGFRNLVEFTDKGSLKPGAGSPTANTTTYTYYGASNINGSDAVVIDNFDEINRPGLPAGSVAIKYEYTSTLNLHKSVRDNKGNTTKFFYDNQLLGTATAGNLTKIEYPSTTPTEYRVTYNTTTGAVTETSQTDPATDTYAHDSKGRVTTHTDPNSAATTFSYDDAITGLATEITRPDHTNGEQFEYNALGVTTKQILPLGGQIVFTLDALYRVTSRKEPTAGGVTPETVYTYDVDSNVLTVEDPAGNVTTNTYDRLGRLSLAENSASGLTAYFHDAEGNVRGVKDPNANITHDTYDELGRPRKSKRPGPPAMEVLHEYDPNGNLIRTAEGTGGSGRVVRRFYDARNNLELTEYPALDPGAPLLADVNRYDANDNVLWSMRTEDGAFVSGTASRFDERNRAHEQTELTADPSGGTITGFTTIITFDRAGNRSRVTDADSNTTRYAADDASRPVAVKDPAGNVVSATSYDDNDRRVDSWMQAPAGTSPSGPGNLDKVAHRVYNARGELLEVHDTDGNVIEYVYDVRGLLIRTFDEDDGKTENDYDALGRPVETRQFVNAGGLGVLRTRYEYDANGNRTAIVDPRGKRYVSSFDQSNRMISSTTPLGFTESWVYDGEGRLASHTDANGKLATFAYDHLDRLILETHTRGGLTMAVLQRSYDAASNLTGIVDSISGVRVSNSYTAANRLSQTAWYLGASSLTSGTLFRDVSYTYTDAGRRESMTGAEGEVLDYTYDAAGLLAAIDRDNTNYVKFFYDEAGRREKVELYDGTERIDVTWTHTARGFINLVKSETAGGTVLTRHSYTYDNRGNPTTATLSHLSPSTTATFTNLPVVNWLVGESWEGAVSYSGNYGYDPNGNRIWHIKDGEHCLYVYDDDNRLLSRLFGAATPTLPVSGTVFVDSTEVGRSSAVVDDGDLTDDDATAYAWRNALTAGVNHYAGLEFAAPQTTDSVRLFIPTGPASTHGLSMVRFEARVGGSWEPIEPVSLTGLEPNPAAPGWYRTVDPVPHEIRLSYLPLISDAVQFLMRNGGGSTAEPNGMFVNEMVTGLGGSATERQELYDYDAQGNLTRRRVLLGSTTLSDESFGYDHYNRLASYVRGGPGAAAAAVTYLASPTGERLLETDELSGTSRWSMYDGADSVADYTQAGSGSPLVLESAYVQGPGIDSKWVRIDGSGTEHYYLPDALGGVSRIARVASGAWTVEDTRVTTAWGEDLDGPDTDDRHGFTQRERDQGGMMYFRARHYDPSTGRFGQKDPADQVRDHYVYVGNNPINRTDPTGLYWTITGFPNAEAAANAMIDLEKVTGLTIMLGGSGGPDVWFGGPHPRFTTKYAMAADYREIWRVQGEKTPTSIHGLWLRLTGADSVWRRVRFQEVLDEYSKLPRQRGYWEVTGYVAMQGLSFGVHQAPPDVQETPGFTASIWTQRIGAVIATAGGGLLWSGVKGPVLWGGTAAAGGGGAATELAAAQAAARAATPFLRQVFGRGLVGAQTILANIGRVAIPAGLTPQMLENYRRVIQLTRLTEDPTQVVRLKIIEELLKKMAGG